MAPEGNPKVPVEVAVNPFTAADVAGILRERGWLTGETSRNRMHGASGLRRCSGRTLRIVVRWRSFCGLFFTTMPLR